MSGVRRTNKALYIAYFQLFSVIFGELEEAVCEAVSAANLG
jgi:hypothetical protein